MSLKDKESMSLHPVKFLLNYQKHKVDISGNYFFPFISYVKFIVVTYTLAGKCCLIF